MKIGTRRYKKLMRVLLQYVFDDNDDKSIIEQAILRYAYRDGYVEIDESNGFDFILSDKGLKLIKE